MINQIADNFPQDVFKKRQEMLMTVISNKCPTAINAPLDCFRLDYVINVKDNWKDEMSTLKGTVVDTTKNQSFEGWLLVWCCAADTYFPSMAKSGAYRRRRAPDIANFGELLFNGITHGDMQWQHCVASNLWIGVEMVIAWGCEIFVPQSTHWTDTKCQLILWGMKITQPSCHQCHIPLQVEYDYYE